MQRWLSYWLQERAVVPIVANTAACSPYTLLAGNFVCAVIRFLMFTASLMFTAQLYSVRARNSLHVGISVCACDSVWRSKGMERSVAALCEATSARKVRVGAVVDKEGCGVLHLAAKEGFDGVVEVLLAYAEQLGIDANVRDKQGFTALVSSFSCNPHALLVSWCFTTLTRERSLPTAAVALACSSSDYSMNCMSVPLPCSAFPSYPTSFA
jgi:hypothetical protein